MICSPIEARLQRPRTRRTRWMRAMSSWNDLRLCGIGQLFERKKKLQLCVQGREVDLAIVRERAEVIEQRRVAVAITEFEVVAYVPSLRQVLFAVTRLFG